MNNNTENKQKNPYDDLFWQSRGYPQKPRNWKQLLEAMGYMDEESDKSASESESSEYDTESDSDYEEQCQQTNTNNNQYTHLKGWPQHPNNIRGNMEWKPV